MANAARQALFVLGLAAIIVLLSRLPADVFVTTQALLLVTAACILLLLAGAVFLAPARSLLARLFALPIEVRPAPALSMATNDEWRGLLRPLFAALVLLAAAGLPVALR